MTRRTPQHLPGRLALLGLGAVAALGLAACSSSSTSSSTTAGSSSATTAASSSSSSAPSCSLVSASTLNAALGTSVGDPTTVVNGPVTVCTYKSSSGGGQVIVRYQTGMSSASFNANKTGFTQSGQNVTPVSGLGDEAYSSTLSAAGLTTNTIVVRKGATELLITGPGTLAQTEALAGQVLAKL